MEKERMFFLLSLAILLLVLIVSYFNYSSITTNNAKVEKTFFGITTLNEYCTAKENAEAQYQGAKIISQIKKGAFDVNRS